MKVSALVEEYLSDLVEPEELRAIQLTSVSKRIRELKVAVADAVYAAKAALQADNMAGSNQALKQAKAFKKELVWFTAEWKRLDGDSVVEAQDEEEEG